MGEVRSFPACRLAQPSVVAAAPTAAPAKDLVAASAGWSRLTWAELAPANRLVLWTIRLLAESQHNWGLVQQELWMCCGPVTIETVLQAFDEMLTTLALHRRRVLAVGSRDDPRISADELTLLTLIAAAQSGHVAKVEALARWLLHTAGHRALTTQIARLADGLSRSRLNLATAGALPDSRGPTPPADGAP